MSKREKHAVFETYKDDAGEFRWRLLSKNGRILADSAEGYKRRNGVTKALHTLLDVLEDASREPIREAEEAE